MTLSSLRSGYLPAAFSWAAQRRLTASEMRERPSEGRTRFFFRSEAYGELTMTFRGRPTLAGALVTAEPGGREESAGLGEPSNLRINGGKNVLKYHSGIIAPSPLADP
jgi:hypothetical protein